MSEAVVNLCSCPPPTRRPGCGAQSGNCMACLEVGERERNGSSYKVHKLEKGPSAKARVSTMFVNINTMFVSFFE